MGLFDQDVNDQNSLRHPGLYKSGQSHLLFNKRQFFLCTLHGISTSFLLFFVPYGAFSVMVKEDGSQLSDQQTLAVTIATSLVIVESVQIGLDTHYWTGVNHLSIRVNLFPTQTDKVRRLQQSRKKQRPQEQNLRRVRRTSSRRSAYAFSHQQGFGELITSGKNMRANRISSTCSYERTAPSSNFIDNVIKRTNAVSCVSFGSPNKHQSDTE
ncbi:Phospholipid-transporting ATPase ID [Oryzias melastigma]|uniref:Phospholipid-transporting ATPase ID n=1 Tax=Oryzias melastigma TaxID=30732 RepID=A0A834FEE9_ORYME|nr:Phospholipid-transporting ATPase ID [Oryzias melastigma]